jgi:hypothetical protein
VQPDWLPDLLPLSSFQHHPSDLLLLLSFPSFPIII